MFKSITRLIESMHQIQCETLSSKAIYGNVANEVESQILKRSKRDGEAIRFTLTDRSPHQTCKQIIALINLSNR